MPEGIVTGERKQGLIAELTQAVLTAAEAPQNGGVTCFLVDREMGWTSRPVPTMGGWSPAELFFESVRVPEDHILGEVGNGFSLGMHGSRFY